MDFMNLTPDGREGSKVFFRSVPSMGEANLNADTEVGKDDKNTVSQQVRAMSQLVVNARGEDSYSDDVKKRTAEAFITYANNVQTLAI